MNDDRHRRHRRVDVDPRRRPVDGFRAHGPGRFERLVEDALASLPDEIGRHLDEVVLAIADVPPPDPHGEGEEVVLARYETATLRPVPDPARPPLTGRLTLYRRPLEARARTKADLAELVRETVAHEVADHFGIDDDRLGDLGFD